jgi:hypothetical protein
VEASTLASGAASLPESACSPDVFASPPAFDVASLAEPPDADPSDDEVPPLLASGSADAVADAPPRSKQTPAAQVDNQTIHRFVVTAEM